VVVAVIAVLVMQVAGDQVVDVITVGNRRVAAVGVMTVRFLVLAAIVPRRAAAGITAAHADVMLFHAAVVDMMQVTIVQIIDVAVVADRGVSAIGAVSVRMLRVDVVFGSHTA
jgi:hypothetical protein